MCLDCKGDREEEACQPKLVGTAGSAFSDNVTYPMIPLHLVIAFF